MQWNKNSANVAREVNFEDVKNCRCYLEKKNGEKISLKFKY